MDLDTEIQTRLAVARVGLAAAKKALGEFEREKEKDAIYISLISTLNNLKISIGELEISIRARAIAYYKTTKKNLPGTTVSKVTDVILKYNPADALEYCKKEGQEFLTFDQVAFEKYAKAIADTPKRLDFVTIENNERYEASIKRDLSGFLPEDPAHEETEEIPF